MVAGWRMAGKALHQRVSAARVVPSMWLTKDVVARRANHLTGVERAGVPKCALCGEGAKGMRDKHLLFGCTAISVVELRWAGWWSLAQ